MIIELDEKNFDESVKTGLKLVEFYATWCGYCKKQEPILQEMDNVWIGQVDGEKSPVLAQKYMITGFPTFVVFKDGKEVDKFSGLHSKFDIMNILTKYMKK